MELESAIERLYADESLAADVDDATAKPLLKWAEAQLPALVTTYPDDDLFDTAFMTFKKLIKSVARYIDGNATMDDMERAERSEKIQTFAADIGLTVDMQALPTLGATATGPEIVAQVLGTPTPAAPPTVLTFPASAADIQPAADTPTPEATPDTHPSDSAFSAFAARFRPAPDVDNASAADDNTSPTETPAEDTGLASSFSTFAEKLRDRQAQAAQAEQPADAAEQDTVQTVDTPQPVETPHSDAAETAPADALAPAEADDAATPADSAEPPRRTLHSIFQRLADIVNPAEDDTTATPTDKE